MIVTVEGEIVGKQRPRVCRYGTYTPKKTKDYEQLIRNSYMAQDGKFFERDIPVQITIKAYKKPPKSTTKKNLKLIEQGLFLWVKKPDIDNICKSVLDALNGIAYADDGQVVKVGTTKEYTLQEERTLINLFLIIRKGVERWMISKRRMLVWQLNTILMFQQ